VRRFIRNKRRLIELLNEQKQAIVDRAVTRGIDPAVPFRQHKDAWVGEVPRHWAVSKIKRNALFNPSKAETSLDRNSTELAVFLPMEKVSASGAIDCSEIRPVSELWDGYTYFRRDDVVVAKITPCFENGKGAYLGALSTDFGFGTTEFIVLRAAGSILPRFLYFLTQTKRFRLRATEFMTGAAGQKRVPVDFIKNYLVALPPVEEQGAILEHMDCEMGKLDQPIARAKQEIELIREYRTRLIADVVTGKVDVRGLATEIIEPAPEDLEPLDDGDNFSEEDAEAPEDFELAEESLK
jgi:type I restriction enzyme S subunit